MLHLLMLAISVHDAAQILNCSSCTMTVLPNNEIQWTIRNHDRDMPCLPDTLLVRYYVTSLKFDNCYIHKTHLDAIGRLPQVHTIQLRLPKNNSVDLSALKLHPKLKRVSCNLPSKCSVIGITEIKNLETMTLLGDVNNSTFDSLIEHVIPKKLSTVFVSCMSDTNRLKKLLTKLTDITELWLSGDSISDQVVASIKSMKKLKILDISSARVTGETVPILPNLAKLSINDCAVTNKGIEVIARNISIEQLFLRKSGTFSVDALVHMKSLKRLNVSDSGVKSLQVLYNMQSLELVYAVGCPLDEQSKRPPERVVLVK